MDGRMCAYWFYYLSGNYGVAVYNRMEQEKLEDESSTFIEPKFAQVHTDNAIHSAAGLELREECSAIMKRQGHETKIGEAVITGAYNLPCRYVLHTVGPIVYGKLTDSHCRQLVSCYKSCLSLAEEQRSR